MGLSPALGTPCHPPSIPPAGSVLDFPLGRGGGGRWQGRKGCLPLPPAPAPRRVLQSPPRASSLDCLVPEGQGEGLVHFLQLDPLKYETLLRLRKCHLWGPTFSLSPISGSRCGPAIPGPAWDPCSWSLHPPCFSATAGRSSHRCPLRVRESATLGQLPVSSSGPCCPARGRGGMPLGRAPSVPLQPLLPPGAGGRSGRGPGTTASTSCRGLPPTRLRWIGDGCAKSHTYNFKLKKPRAVYGSAGGSAPQPHKDHIIVQAIMCRVDYIYISKWFGKQRPTYGQGRRTGSFGVTNDP